VVGALAFNELLSLRGHAPDDAAPSS
jgi:hypothetical protein